MSETNVLGLLPRLPPSVQSIVQTLHGQQPLTGADIRVRTGLPRRTVYAGLVRLKEIGVLQERPSLRDARQSYFWLDVSKLAHHQDDAEPLAAA
jgi:DNA-binding IclR family transcriptional regulator